MDDVPQTPWINAGIYVINTDFILPRLDELLPEQPNTNLEKTLLERLGKDDNPKLAGYLLDLEVWFDVGTLVQLVDTNIYIASMKGREQKK